MIIVDTGSRDRISDMRWDRGAQTIKIDHHVNVDAFADINWSDESFSSASEMIYCLIYQSKGNLHLTQDGARCLYAGIVGDTGRFLYDDTSSYTLQVASELLKFGFDAPTVNRHEDDISPNVAKMVAYALQNLEIEDSGVGHIILKRDIIQKFGLSSGELDAVIPVIGRISTIQIWAIFREKSDGKYHVNLRSKGTVIIDIAKKHHGGDHPLSSGATANDLGEVQQIIEELNELVVNE
ncbi:3'-to-5' oligoribonuclease A [Pediococcus damnosus]|uniref:DHH family phosphoesterase n=1 Tax=Pediococcus damnosus TaxID=51663 RepID=UPI00078CF084|nr:bifunctional oligoribonuclease/PAP phosphatase NrnA [Pediococcus damnosus]AMV61181.1 3'-to-5' oligoribonuclease A [Pediococcus damnosus]AMV65540.1 3'-to-5' oligoribonuclease A [Pediococcus damnosus]